jgi:hypothetical protein
MTITHTSRTGKIYYLHTGPKRGGGIQYFVSTQSTGPLADCLPEGFEVHETVNGQVFLRRKQPKLIQDEEAACIEGRLSAQRGSRLYKVEVRGDTLGATKSTVSMPGNFGTALGPLLLGGLLKAGVSFAIIVPGCALLGVAVTGRSFVARNRLHGPR